jgi:aspartyl-tRNA(Asn)/glutamyl-tRNA(Gln) amidotransferase subunit C
LRPITPKSVKLGRAKVNYTAFSNAPKVLIRSIALDPSEIRKLAELAKIEVDDSQITEVAARINDVLALVDQLQAADTSGVTPMAHPLDAVQRLRADEVTENIDRDHYQQAAPQAEAGLYLVPKVID